MSIPTITLETDLAGGEDSSAPAFGDEAFGAAPFGGWSEWTDLTDEGDVLMRHGIRWQRGVFGSGPLDLTAQPGSMSWALNNSAGNSAGIQGYYSPFGPNVRSGFRHGIVMRLKIESGSVSRYVFRGKVREIRPEPGQYGTQATHCLAEDWLREFYDIDDLELTLQESVRSDELITALVGLAETAPQAQSIDTGRDTYTFAFDDLGDNPSVGRVVQDICQSERGYLYLRGDLNYGETLRFENRTARAQESVADTFTDADMVADPRSLEVPSSLDRIINEVEVGIRPRKVDSSATTVLVQIEEPVEVRAGKTVERWAPYTDPNQQAQFVGGKDMVQPASGTDWAANSAEDGSGSTISGDFSITATYFGSTVLLSITNNGSITGYVMDAAENGDGMQCRGKGLYRYKPIRVRATEGGTSQSDFGKRLLSFSMPYQSDDDTAFGAAEQIANIYGNVGNVPTRVRLLTERPSVLQRALALDIGDRIALTETVTGNSATEVIINGIEGEVTRQGAVRIWFTLAPASTTEVFILDDAVAGVLDTSRLAYG